MPLASDCRPTPSRGFQGEEILRQVAACGISRVELCTMQFDIGDPASTRRVLASYRAATSIAIDAFGVHSCGGPHDEAMFAFAVEAGARVIGVDFPPTLSTAPFRAAERLAERYDLRLAIHNHGGYHWLGSAQMLERVLAETFAAHRRLASTPPGPACMPARIPSACSSAWASASTGCT